MIKKFDEFIHESNKNQLTEIIDYNIHEQDMMSEMANISKSHTKLPVIVWVESGATRDTQHNIPRLKFQNSTSDKISSSNLIPISISKSPEILIKDFNINDLNISKKDFDILKKWISFHYDSLMKYWDQKIDTVDFISSLNQNRDEWSKDSE